MGKLQQINFVLFEIYAWKLIIRISGESGSVTQCETKGNVYGCKLNLLRMQQLLEGGLSRITTL